VRQILRAIVAMLAVAALAGGGTMAFADRDPGDGGGSGSSGSGSSGEEHGGHHGDGDDDGAKHEAGEDRHDNQGPAKHDEDDDAQPADVYTLAEPEHGNPEGVAFDKRSGFFFVSAVGDGSIYRGKLGDTATPVPVFIPGAAGQSATGLKVKGGPFPGGDGLLIDRGRLLVVQGSADRFPNRVVNHIELRHDGGEARLEDQRTDDSF
jgi:hypothetical protein